MYNIGIIREATHSILRSNYSVFAERQIGPQGHLKRQNKPKDIKHIFADLFFLCMRIKGHPRLGLPLFPRPAAEPL